MLFFLHIPRTAGRTYHTCFLKLSKPPSQRCEKSYDLLRLNYSVPACSLLGSHDDFSVVDFLPEATAVVTQMRDPVERLLSAYEFTLEVAVRGYRADPPLPQDPKKVSTRNVWPWSHLIPWMEERLRERRAAVDAMRNSGGAIPGGAELDPYDNALVPPLADFIAEPIVAELLHNGAALQVLGLTNYSHWREARPLRRCMRDSPAARARLQALALARLDTFAHVGLFEQLEDSISSLAAELGISLWGPAWKALPQPGANPDAAGGDVAPAQRGDAASLHPLALGRAYGHCVERARRKSEGRRAQLVRSLTLPDGRAVRFGKAARAALPPATLAAIRAANSVDAALHARAGELFAERLAAHRAAGALQAIPALTPEDLAALDTAQQHAAAARTAPHGSLKEGLIPKRGVNRQRAAAHSHNRERHKTELRRAGLSAGNDL